MKSIILLDAAVVKRIIHSSLNIFCNLNKNIKAMPTFNFRK